MALRGSSKHRPGFHALVLAIGFIVGARMQQAARILFPAGAAKQFLTAGVTAVVRAVAHRSRPDQVFFRTVALDVSLLSLVGVLVAYLIARSLF